MLRTAASSLTETSPYTDRDKEQDTRDIDQNIIDTLTGIRPGHRPRHDRGNDQDTTGSLIETRPIHRPASDRTRIATSPEPNDRDTTKTQRGHRPIHRPGYDKDTTRTQQQNADRNATGTPTGIQPGCHDRETDPTKIDRRPGHRLNRL